MKRHKIEHPARIPSVTAAMREQNRGEIPSDMLGSYTGQARYGDRPVQDADDL